MNQPLEGRRVHAGKRALGEARNVLVPRMMLQLRDSVQLLQDLQVLSLDLGTCFGVAPSA